jgi:peptidyl-prolyl cis-trans isomerase SurA
MKKLLLIILSSFCISYFSFAQKNQDKILMTVGNESVNVGDFKYVYEKNNNNKNDLYSKASVDEYLNLYAIFRMKVQEAKSMKLDTISSLLEEYKTYKNQLSQAYLSDKEIKDQMVNETYNRLKEEVKASHILVKCTPSASPDDTLQAYNKISDIRKRAENGENFGDLASKLSDDPSAKDNRGDLGYFTALQMVYPFETAAYNTPIGKISEIVRTKFGYHIIKVEKRRNEMGELQCKHIFIRTGKDASREKEAFAKNKADSLYNIIIKNPDSFDDILKRNTDDKNSLSKEGTLDWFSSGKMVQAFEDAAFALQLNEISKPVKTNYGYHIIKLLNKRNLQPLEKIKDELISKIKKDTRSNVAEQLFVNRVKKEYGFKEDKNNFNITKNSVDTSFYTNTWDNSKITNKNLFTLASKSYNSSDFMKYVSDNKIKYVGYKNPQVAIQNAYNDYITKVCTDYEETQLPRKYPEYKALSQEYLDGILLFDLTDRQVWSKASRDTIGLKQFYNKNKEKYLWGERADVILFTSQKKESTEQMMKMYNSGKSLQAIRDTMKMQKKYSSIEENKFERGQNDLVGSDNFTKGYQSQIQTLKNNMMSAYIIKDIIPPSHKELDEARGFIIADYQSELEKNWINEMKNKFPVKIDQKALDQLYKN